jgi:CelD/BcsL family acetyltransferase involved in cellulose biosynthesis
MSMGSISAADLDLVQAKFRRSRPDAAFGDGLESGLDLKPRTLSWEIISAGEIENLGQEAWDALSRESVEHNPFYSRSYVLAGLGTIDRKACLQALTFRETSGNLVGLFPFVRRWTAAFGAANLYQFCGTPLVSRDHASAVIGMWLEGVSRGIWPAVWSLPNVRVNSSFVLLVQRHARERGLQVRLVSPYTRPLLTRNAGSFERHVETCLAKGRRKDIQRSIRRLRELGELRFERAEHPERVRALVSDFLTIEASGWKGTAGTAFLAHPSHAAFARAAFQGSGEAPVAAVMDALLLDGRPIALSVNLRSGRTLFTPKGTYDEHLRSLSPGIVLEYMVVERLFHEHDWDLMDACTTVDGHVVQGLWDEGISMANLILGKPGSVRVLTAAMTSRERLKRAVKRMLRHPALRRRFNGASWTRRFAAFPGRPSKSNRRDNETET